MSQHNTNERTLDQQVQASVRWWKDIPAVIRKHKFATLVLLVPGVVILIGELLLQRWLSPSAPEATPVTLNQTIQVNVPSPTSSQTPTTTPEHAETIAYTPPTPKVDSQSTSPANDTPRTESPPTEQHARDAPSP